MSKIEIQGIRKRMDGHEVLRGISFRAAPGDIVSVIGPSGGGKTTLFRCILGELVPDEGAVLIDGVDVTDVQVEKRGVGIVYQEYALFPHMTAQQNVGYGLRVRRVPSDRAKARVKELLEMVHLAEKGDKYPDALSGGERQRVALARALAVEPRILLLDEAFTALDASTRTEVIHEVRTIIRRLNLTTLLITHDQEEAFLFARRVVVLNDGILVASGDPEAVMKDRNPFIQDFVKMAVFHRARIESSPDGKRFVTLKGGSRIPITIPGMKEGDEVHVMVKKGPDRERVEVWPLEQA